MSQDLSEECINTIRILAVDMVERACSGHPGAPMGLAPLAHLLFCEYLRFDPLDLRWVNRDRFIMSNGHGCALNYIMLHLFGCGLTMDDLKQFRQLKSLTPGHPESHLTPGIEVTTGPLGQGVANAVGMAIAQARLGFEFNREGFPLFDHRIFCIVGDGCLQEGISSEAVSLAGHLGLKELIIFYDDNGIQIDGSTDLAFTEDVTVRFQSYGFNTIEVDLDDGSGPLGKAIDEAIKGTRPTLIKVRTVIGKGSIKEGTEKVHGAPLGAEDVTQVKERYKFDKSQSFVVPETVKRYYNQMATKKHESAEEWHQMFQKYQQIYPELGSELRRRISGLRPDNWKVFLPRYSEMDLPKSTRVLSGDILDRIADHIPELIGGSADLTPSNLTRWRSAIDFQCNRHEGRYIRFGVREHAMAAICNGIAAYNVGFVPFAATFLNFITYAWGAVRLSALSRYQVIYIMTHDSIGLGEDGPTHQPIETLAALRALPQILVFRPADGNEVSGCYGIALEHQGPSVLCLTRQDVPHLKGSRIDKVVLGAYTLIESGIPDVILIGTGSEVSVLVVSAEALSKSGIKTNVVSMPCVELFEMQSLEYRQTVLIPNIPVLSLEASSSFGWSRYAHVSMGMKTFGDSAPFRDIYRKHHLTEQDVVNQVNKITNYYKTHHVPELQIVSEIDSCQIQQ